MMLNCAEAALSERDYINALEYMLAVSSVDDHPDVTTALAVTVFDIIDAMELSSQGIEHKNAIIEDVTEQKCCSRLQRSSPMFWP
jgi:hypothetical protein